MRLLGIDYGRKRIGIAVSDEAGQFAFPLSVISNDKNIIKNIKKICDEKNVGKIILGKSLDYKGKPNPIMEDIEKFKKVLEKEIGLPVDYEPEFLTSQEAKRGPAKPEKIDASAAAIILRSYIEKER